MVHVPSRSWHSSRARRRFAPAPPPSQDIPSNNLPLQAPPPGGCADFNDGRRRRVIVEARLRNLVTGGERGPRTVIPRIRASVADGDTTPPRSDELMAHATELRARRDAIVKQHVD